MAEKRENCLRKESEPTKTQPKGLRHTGGRWPESKPEKKGGEQKQKLVGSTAAARTCWSNQYRGCWTEIGLNKRIKAATRVE